jgi:hypothetical protein
MQPDYAQSANACGLSNQIAAQFFIFANDPKRTWTSPNIPAYRSCNAAAMYVSQEKKKPRAMVTCSTITNGVSVPSGSEPT